MRLNEDTYREELLIAGGKPADPKGKRGLKTFYGSIHDIVSFSLASYVSLSDRHVSVLLPM